MHFLCIAAIVSFHWLPSSDSPQNQPWEGALTHQRGEHAQTRSGLKKTFGHDRLLTRKQRSVEYWLAVAHQNTGRSGSLFWVAEENSRSSLKYASFDAQFLDFCLSQTVSQREPSPRATEPYFRLLRRIGPNLAPETRTVLRKVVAQLSPLLGSEKLEKHVVRGSGSDPEDWTFQKGAGTWLLVWWRRQDPVPKTEKNERVQEHLRRVDRAAEKFTSEGRIAGWDDRGDTYIRYGRPDQKYNVEFNDMGFLSEVVRPGVPVSRSDFPENVIWKYPTLSSSGKYLFVKDQQQGEFELSTAADLLPESLQGPFGPGNRQQNVAYSSMAALRYIYSQLSLQYHDRGNTLSKLNGWFSYQASRRKLSDLSGDQEGREIGFGPGARRVFGGTGPEKGYPSSVATASISDAKGQERQFFRRRSREMPRAHSSAKQMSKDLPVEYRVARFINQNGTPYTEVYWGGRSGPFADVDSTSGVGVSVIQHDTRYRRLDKVSEWYGGKQLADEEWVGAVPQRTVVSDTANVSHVALQWSWYSSSDTSAREGRQPDTRVSRIDTLRSFRSETSELEMSDLRLMSVPPAARTEKPSPLQKTVPYPYDTATVETPLFLYFELYHLGRSSQKRTQYTVTYEVRREASKGFLGRLFGDDVRTEVTSTSTDYSGRAARTEEYLQLGLEGNPEQPQPTKITVGVTDNVTGQEVERSLNLILTPHEDSEP